MGWQCPLKKKSEGAAGEALPLFRGKITSKMTVNVDKLITKPVQYLQLDGLRQVVEHMTVGRLQGRNHGVCTHQKRTTARTIDTEVSRKNGDGTTASPLHKCRRGSAEAREPQGELTQETHEREQHYKYLVTPNKEKMNLESNIPNSHVQHET